MIDRPDQLWFADITNIPVQRSFPYQVAITALRQAQEALTGREIERVYVDKSSLAQNPVLRKILIAVLAPEPALKPAS